MRKIKTMQNNFHLHKIAWDKESAANFWNYSSKLSSFEDSYFSRIFGREIIAYANRYLSSNAYVLDYGCGPGYLIFRLLEGGFVSQGVDYSSEAIEIVNQKFADNALFKKAIKAEGLPLPIAENNFDAVFLVETLEHLLPVDLAATLKEIYRVLKPNGHIIITVPNEEKL